MAFCEKYEGDTNEVNPYSQSRITILTIGILGLVVGFFGIALGEPTLVLLCALVCFRLMIRAFKNLTCRNCRKYVSIRKVKEDHFCPYCGQDLDA